MTTKWWQTGTRKKEWEADFRCTHSKQVYIHKSLYIHPYTESRVRNCAFSVDWAAHCFKGVASSRSWTIAKRQHNTSRHPPPRLLLTYCKQAVCIFRAKNPHGERCAIMKFRLFPWLVLSGWFRSRTHVPFICIAIFLKPKQITHKELFQRDDRPLETVLGNILKLRSYCRRRLHTLV